ncbi:MAG TPA: metal ABC transporter substrate-binding protein [Tepidiformaceae bacterium]|nr:metal ABC transporter substrate-binding protein [Tepidiformaceae bacterium]
MLLSRRAALFTIPLLLFPLAAACGSDADPDDGRLQVIATTAQIAALTREAAGDLVELTVLIPPGVDSHDYEPTADDLKAIARADVLFRNGIGLDDFLDDAIDNAGGDAIDITVTDGVEVRQSAFEERADEKADEHEEGDPHVWHDPVNAKVMLQNIASALAEADPDNAGTYTANATAYAATLDETDAEIRALIETIPVANRKMVTNHEAFGYFIDRYGLEFVGAVIPSLTTGAEPSAADLAALADLIEEEGVKAIFAESSIDPKIAEQIARDTGVRIVDDLYGDSLGEPGTPEGTLDGMLLANARKIVEALK